MKKILSVILATVVALSFVGMVLAENDVVGTKPEVSDGTPLAPPSHWAESDVEKADVLNITEKGKIYRYSMPITREEFCNLVVNMMETFGITLTTDNPQRPLDVRDTESVNVLKLYKAGIILGKEHNKTGVLFDPDAFLTREQAATILNRLIDFVSPDLVSTELYFEFEDNAKISHWAMNSIQRICNLGIMKGVGNNRFAPQDNYTTEQAIVTLVRVYANAGMSKSDADTSNLSVAISDTMSFADKLNIQMPTDQNYMFSPLSIKMALMMAANGATGETREEILKALCVSELEDYNKNIEQMLDKYSESEILTLNVSNSIWLNSDKTSQCFSKDYVDTLSKIFDATADVVTDKTAMSKINGWVNDKTEGKIPAIITEDNKEFWAMLVNAVYFKGRWQNEFHKNATKKDVFTSNDGTESEIDFMNRRAWMNYANTDGVLIVALPYLTRQDVFDENGEHVETKKLDGVNISMYLMMSDKPFSPEEILNKTEIDTAYISLSVPKFDIEYNTGLNELLNTIGINKAFQESAEFEKMFDHGNMWIDKGVHKTYIKVDEEGTEAAAVTAMGMAGSSLPPEPIELKFNKPFTFVIKDDANSEILFVGKYAFVK